MADLRDKKIAIIIHSENEQYLEECLGYVERITIPEGYELEVLTITEMPDMAMAYNEGMSASDAKYKLYLSERAILIRNDCLEKAIQLFLMNPQLGMLGIYGVKCLEENKVQVLGKLILGDSEKVELLQGEDINSAFCEADNIDAAFIMTQYDIPWEEGCDSLEEIIYRQCALIKKMGYIVGVTNQDTTWCQVDRCTAYVTNNEGGKLDKNVLKNIMEICKAEQKKGQNSFSQGENIEWLVQKYNYIKFYLRRMENHFSKELMQDFYEEYNNGLFSQAAIDVILRHEIFYQRRVRQYLKNHSTNSLVKDADGVTGKEMHVATSLNRKYVAPVCVMLESLYQNNREIPLYVHIFHNELNEDDKKVICEHGEKWGASVDFFWVDSSLFQNMPLTEMWSAEAFFRLTMIEQLPQEVDRVLYLDVDTIVLRPVYDLYFSDFEGNDLIACKDMGSGIPFRDVRATFYKDDLGKEGFAYCCSGVMVWNLKELRGKVTLETYLKVAEECNYQFLAVDQDLINKVHACRIKCVEEYRYDCFVHGWDWSVEEAKRFVSVLHFAGPKPWDGRRLQERAFPVWWEYAKNTPLYYELLEQVQKQSVMKDIQVAQRAQKQEEETSFYRRLTVLKRSHRELSEWKNRFCGEKCIIVEDSKYIQSAYLDMISNEYKSFACDALYRHYDNTAWRPDYVCVSNPAFLHKNYHELIGQNDAIMFLTDMRDYGFEDDHFPRHKDWLFWSYPEGYETEDKCFSEDITAHINIGKITSYVALQICMYLGFEEIYLLGIDNEKWNSQCAYVSSICKHADEVAKEMNRKIYQVVLGDEEALFKAVKLEDL